MKRLATALMFALLAAGSPQQTPPKPSPISPAEQAALEKALGEAGGSPVEYLRAIEKHLAKYPNSPRRPELERAAVRAAAEANDIPDIIMWGERVLGRQPDDLQVLERVSRALLDSGSADGWARALKYAMRYETLLAQRRSDAARAGGNAAERVNEIDQAIATALRYEARATGNLGRPGEALALAQRSFDAYANAESARERAFWLERLGRTEEAVRALADAFTIPDPRNTDSDRARDRGRMGELYVKLKASEAGLGDLILAAYDRTAALIHARELRLHADDPNSALTDPMTFTIRAVDGPPLRIATLEGKVAVLDFWATWCGPCRAQHPLYEQVKQRFAGNPNVVFLSIDADEDHSLVKPFLTEVKWPSPVYFEDGLSRAWGVHAIPTTIVLDRSGRVAARMNGYVPERFVDMLGERITEALAR